MSHTRAIIMADGSGERWANYMGIPKQLAPVDGEPIICRTIRLLKKSGIEDIWITTHNPAIKIEGTNIYEPVNNKTGVDKFLAAKPIWGEDTTLFLYGDVFYTESCFQEILATESDSGYIFYGRFDGNEFTSKYYGEIFGLKIKGDKGKKELERGCIAINKHLEEGGRRGAAWELYRYLGGADNLNAHKHYPNFCNISDMTDDFDCGPEYDEWLKVWSKQLTDE